MAVVLLDHQYGCAHLLCQVVNWDVLQQSLGGVVVTKAVKAALFVRDWALEQVAVFQHLTKRLVPVVWHCAIRQSEYLFGHSLFEYFL